LLFTHRVHTASSIRHTGCIQPAPPRHTGCIQPPSQDTLSAYSLPTGPYSHPHKTHIYFSMLILAQAMHALITSSLQQIRPEDLFCSSWLLNLAERDLERKSPGASIYISHINIYIYPNWLSGCWSVAQDNRHQPMCFQTFYWRSAQAMPEMQPSGQVDHAAMAIATFITQTWRHIEDTFCQRSWKLFLGDNVFQRIFKTMLLSKHANKHNLKQHTFFWGRHWKTY
jgi:hypothetical protein